MNRFAYNQLLEWEKSERSSLLIVGGVPGVGKKDLVLKFANEIFDDYLYYDFLVEGKNLTINFSEKQGKSLVVIDNIMGDKGFLLRIKKLSEEFENFKFIILDPFAKEGRGDNKPVAVSYLILYPLSFEEFLFNVNYNLFNDLAALKGAVAFPEILHLKLLHILNDYLVVGGMPDSVRIYINLGLDFACIRLKQAEIINNIFDKLSSYYKVTEYKNLMNIINLILPTLVRDNKKFKLTDISSSTRFSSFSKYFKILENLNLVYITRQKKGHNLEIEEKSLIIYLFDVGILGFLGNIPKEIYTSPILLSNQITLALCSNFVAGELFSTTSLPIYFWNKNLSKIEFLWKKDSILQPLEMKNDDSGKLKSLISFSQIIKYGDLMRINLKKPDIKGSIKTYPIYLVKSLYRKFIS